MQRFGLFLLILSLLGLGSFSSAAAQDETTTPYRLIVAKIDPSRVRARKPSWLLVNMPAEEC
jgi:hypothetical protein